MLEMSKPLEGGLVEDSNVIRVEIQRSQATVVSEDPFLHARYFVIREIELN